MHKRGEQHHNAVLSDAEVEEMRTLREYAPWLWSYGALADHFGCSESTARDIVTYRTRNKKVPA
jgi:hypothetical protein